MIYTQNQNRIVAQHAVALVKIFPPIITPLVLFGVAPTAKDFRQFTLPLFAKSATPVFKPGKLFFRDAQNQSDFGL